MRVRVDVEGRAYDVEVDVAEAGIVRRRGRNIPAAVLRPRPPQRLPEDSVCRSPIAGRVSAVSGEAGRSVRRHEPVVLLEAMKMEVPIGPAVDGVVKAIRVQPGDAVAAGQVLFELD
jgi:biotin carboxyl carrier protein